MDEYRKKAQEKYDIERKKKEYEQKEEERKRLEENQRKIDEENIKKHKILSIFLEIEDHIDNIQTNNSSENILYCLTMIESIIQININFLKKEDKIQELQNTVFNIINILNMLHENSNKKDLIVLKNISEIMKIIFNLIGLDIEIELMNTTNDEEFANEINRKLIDTTNDENFAKEINEEINKLK